MNQKLNNNSDISEEISSYIHKKWEKFDKKSNWKAPSEFFKALPLIAQNEFEEKLLKRCLQILKKNKGYNQWAYSRFRFDNNGLNGAVNLKQEVYKHLFRSNNNDPCVNLRELFKDGSQNINRNLTQIIKRVLIDTRNTTVIDQLLRRIERLVDNKNTIFIRTRTNVYGLRADYFSIKNKKFEEREPTHEEIEKAISLVGNIKETPAKSRAKQASRVYTTPQLTELLEKVCRSLPTDVTPNTLERIFIDLIPGFLPPDFLLEKAFQIYGDVKLFQDTDSNLAFEELSTLEKIVVVEIVKESFSKIVNKKIKSKVKKLYSSDSIKELKPNKLVKNNLFKTEDKAQEFLDTYFKIIKEMYSAAGSKELGDIAFQILMQNL